jgi:dTMP kinase
MQAILITLEGGDGAGKGTQIKLITEYIKNNNLKVAFLHFPMYGHNEASAVIAAYLRGEYGSVDEVNPYFVANAYAMDRFLYLPELKKLMRENDVVLLDRYVYSNMAYQAAKYPLDSKESFNIAFWIENFEFEFLKLPRPDLTFFLNNDISVLQKRLDSARTGEDRNYLNGKDDIHEKDIELQERVKHNYLQFADIYEDYEIVNCEDENGLTLPPDELFESYKPAIREFIISEWDENFDS